MITCGIEIKGSEVILCLLSKQDGLFQIADCRQVRHTLSNPNDSESVRKFQFMLKKLFEDYKVKRAVIRERPTKGKFAGGAVGFKIEAAIQLIDTVEVDLFSGAKTKDIIQHNPMPIPFKATGLRAFQEGAFTVAYAALSEYIPDA
ncbi:DUF3010 family protein [Marinomonas rhizomae]|mgnify:CR=1 FL=1|uniref:DUF3010 family protein n=1 Tax=Marinomonas rhizomae TaxID=491948 RepID=A0A366IXN4_9GAMM|nr:DUF3010 family protein [Marinomonas rhizomae]RBP78595.1 DUF3010 family protein [Marinomonas rhizomae]RNF70235.1 DUF3010 family protein [Marinomonas rhizomae]